MLHAGSGVPDIFQAWKDAGLDAPIVEEKFGGGTPDRTILTLPLGSTIGTSLGTGLGTNLGISDEANEETKKKLIIDFCQKPRSKAEIQQYLNISSESYVRQKILTPLLEEGLLARTIPEKPSSPKQKYIAIKLVLMHRASNINYALDRSILYVSSIYFSISKP